MIKLCFCLKRKAGMSLDEFQTYWRQRHAPLVKRHAEVLRIRRYEQVHTLDHGINSTLQGSRNSPAPYDGIAELWWDSADDLATAMASETGARAAAELLEDETKFIDHKNSPLWIAKEHVIIGNG